MARPRTKPPTLPDDLDLEPPAQMLPEDDGDERGGIGAAPEEDKPRRVPLNGRVANLDREDDRMERLRRERAKQRLLERDNPFLVDEAEHMPRLPDDDPDWAYKWIRWQIPGSGYSETKINDTKNIQAHSGGRLPYEFVRMDELPEKWKARLKAFAAVEGKHAGLLVYHDLLAGRTPKYLRDMKVEADNIKAKLQRDEIRATVTENAERMGSRAVIEDKEYRDYLPRDYEV